MTRFHLAVLSASSLAATFALAGPVELVVTRVALFSSGVGYFERDASVSGNAQAELKFRTDQINDMIKSMVVQDFNGGKIGVISYATQDPIEKTLRSFAVDLTGKPTLGQLLDQLRGEPVELTGPVSATGTIVGVEKTAIVNPDGKTLQEIEWLNLLTSAGLQRLDVAKLQGIKLTSEKIDAELRKALATLATGHDADKKSVQINFEGMGDRKVRVAYLLEAPVWQTAYRLVLADDKKPFMQGWATVTNATEGDWNNVRLSLVSGRPISFRMDLYTPLYVPRPLEQLELYASLRPPSYEGGFPASPAMAPPPAPAEKPMAGRAMMKMQRGGGVAGGARVTSEADGYEDIQEAELRKGIELAGTGVSSLATAQQAGELFAYHIDTPVSIPRQHSAMLPIVNQAIEADKVSIFNVATHAKYPLNGLELKNTTGLNLMQGPVTVFDANIYAGDAKLPDLKPDEKRLVAYALDLSTEVMIKQQPKPDELVSLKIAKGTLWHRHKFVDSREYDIKNKVDKDRTVIVEQAYTEDWKLVEPKEPYEKTQTLLRFKVTASAQKTTPLNVSLERVGDQSIMLLNAGLDDIRIFLRAKVISPAVKQAMEKVIAFRTELDEITRKRTRLEKQQEEAVAEQGRIRENLKTLDKSTDAYQRQLKSFDEVDGRIAEYRQQITTARDQEEQKRKALEEYLLALDVE